MELASHTMIPNSKLPQNPTRFPFGSPGLRLPRNPVKIRSAASKRDGCGWDFGGGLVDENMAVLRKRIHEMRVEEERTDTDMDPPPDWMEWEKRYFEGFYGSDVCAAVGVIQFFLMNVRPGVAVGLVGLFLFSVPTSMILIGLSLLEVARSGVWKLSVY